MKRFAATLAALACASAAQAQYTNILENATTQVVDSAWTTNTVVVGGTTAGNTLLVVDGGRVTNEVSTIGQGPGAATNIVALSGDAFWITTGGLTVGDEGSFNALNIFNGAVVASSNATIGAAAGSSNNLAYVDGAGARWEIDDTLRIGGGAGNAVAVEGGGTVSAQSLSIATNNAFYLRAEGTLAIRGGFSAGMEGFEWGGSSHLSVGGVLDGMATTNGSAFLDGGRRLTLDGGTWDTGTNNLVVGLGSAGLLAATNGGWVLVGGISTNDLAAGGGIAIGSTNGAARLVVDNGSAVQASGGLHIGATNGLAGSVTVTNGGVLRAGSLAIADGSVLDLADGGTLAVEGDLDLDSLAASLDWQGGGHLAVVGGELVKSNGLDGARRTLFLDGGTWTLGGDLRVEGTTNQLVVVDGGMVTSTNGFVAGSSNTVWVSGEGSLWRNSGMLGIAESNNTVNIQGGGRVEADALDIADGSRLNLDGGGTLAMAGDFDVATQGNLNWNRGGTLSIGGALTGMGTVSNEAGWAAILDGGRDLVLDGDTGTWLNGSTNLVVGYNASGSDLAITNGATVSNADGYIGWGTGSGNNTVLVGGSGSAWTNSGGSLHVGAYWSGTNLANAGSGNRLDVRDGGWVFVGEAATNAPGGGLLVASTNGARLVVGNGRVETDGTLILGLDAATTGTNTIRSGGTVSAGDLAIATGSHLDLQRGGTFAIATNFNVAAFATNGFNWGEGATLSVGGELSGMPATNGAALLDGARDLVLDGGSWDIGTNQLVVGSGSSGSDLVLRKGGRLESGTAFIGRGTNAANNSIAIFSDSTWMNAGDLWIGHGGGTNHLAIRDGGVATTTGRAFIGNAGSIDNFAVVDGSNSLWHVQGALALNSGNELAVGSGATVRVDGGFNVFSNTYLVGTGTILLGGATNVLALTGRGIGIDAGLVFDGGTGSVSTVAVNDGVFSATATLTNQYRNFHALALANSTLAGSGAIDAFGTVSMAGGTIDPAENGTGRLEIGGSFSSSGTVYRAQVFGDLHDELVFTGTNRTDLAGLSADVTVLRAPSGFVATLLAAEGGLTNAFASVNIADRLLLYDAFLEVTETNVNVRIEPNNEQFSSALSYAATESVRAGFGGMKDAVFTRTKQLRRNLVATAHAVPQEAFLLSGTNAPAGPMGPGDQNTVFGMHAWFQHYGGQGDYAGNGASQGFKLNNSGSTFGFDRLFGEALALGVNYTYARSAARAANADRLDAETYWIGAYGEWVGREGLFVDAMAAWGRSNYDSQRVEENYSGTASFRGQAVGLCADVGQYYHYGTLALAPYAGLHYLALWNDAHTETEQEGSQLRVDGTERTWLESALGLKARQRFDTRIGRFQASGFAEWRHDFIQEDVYATLSANGLPPVDMARISPDADTLGAGLGLSWICTDYLEIGVGYNGRFSGNYEEHTGSAMLDIRF